MTANADKIFEMIVDNVKDITADIQHEPITRSSMLSPLGMDSVGRAELIERMLEELSLSAPRFEFHQANNLGELAEMFAKKLEERNLSGMKKSIDVTSSALI